MANISKRIVENAFSLFCKVYGLRTEAKTTNKPGIVYSDSFITLNYFGGYRIEIINPDTTETVFDGHGRKTGREMYEYLQGLLAAKKEDAFKKIQL